MPETLGALRHDDMLERIVLGAILAEHKQAAEAQDALCQEDFYHPHHQKIFWVMRNLAETGEPINLVSVR